MTKKDTWKMIIQTLISDTWKMIIQTLISILTAIGTTLGMVSCVA